MKGWLARATASTICRGEGRTSIARWSHWFSSTGPVDDRHFQGSGDPYPGHWRESPQSWPPGFTDEEAADLELRRVLGELPHSWRAVVSARDVAGRDAAQVAAELDLTARQEQQILNRARAALRASLSRLARQGPR